MEDTDVRSEVADIVNPNLPDELIDQFLIQDQNLKQDMGDTTAHSEVGDIVNLNLPDEDDVVSHDKKLKQNMDDTNVHVRSEVADFENLNLADKVTDDIFRLYQKLKHDMEDIDVRSEVADIVNLNLPDKDGVVSHDKKLKQDMEDIDVRSEVADIVNLNLPDEDGVVSHDQKLKQDMEDTNVRFDEADFENLNHPGEVIDLFLIEDHQPRQNMKVAVALSGMADILHINISDKVAMKQDNKNGEIDNKYQQVSTLDLPPNKDCMRDQQLDVDLKMTSDGTVNFPSESLKNPTVTRVEEITFHNIGDKNANIPHPTDILSDDQQMQQDMADILNINLPDEDYPAVAEKSSTHPLIRVRNLLSLKELSPPQIKEGLPLKVSHKVRQRKLIKPQPPPKPIPQIRIPPFMYRRPMHAVEGKFANLANIRVPQDVEAILGLGPRFTSTGVHALSEYIDQLRYCKNYPKSLNKDPSQYLSEYLKHSYTVMMQALTRRISPYNNILTKALKNAKLFLNNHPELCVLEIEEGKNTVLVERNDYNREIDVWIKKCTREGIYQEISDQQFLKRCQTECYKKYQLLHRDLLNNKQAAVKAGRPEPYPNKMQQILNKLNRDNMSPPFMYGVVKICKGIQMIRPMFNTRGWYSYGLEKVIGHVLRKAAVPCRNIYNVSDITTTASNIRNTPVLEDYSFVNIHIDDVYTSLCKTDIIRVLRSLVDTADFRKSCSIDPDLFVRMLEVRLDHMQMFIHRGKVYRQLRGLPQGAPDSQILVDIVLGFQLAHHEYTNQGSPILPLRTCKHNDELLCYLPDKYTHAFRESLSKFTRLNLSMKVELKMNGGCQNVCGQTVTGASTFLDIEIYRGFQKFLTAVHDDTTFVPLTNVPDKWKNFIVQSNLRRMLERVSNSFLLKELMRLEHKFQDDMYPDVLNYLISRYIGIYQEIMRNSRPINQNPICNFESISERISILQHIKESYKPILYMSMNNNNDMQNRRHSCENNNRQSKRKMM